MRSLQLANPYFQLLLLCIIYELRINIVANLTGVLEAVRRKPRVTAYLAHDVKLRLSVSCQIDRAPSADLDVHKIVDDFGLDVILDSVHLKFLTDVDNFYVA